MRELERAVRDLGLRGAMLCGRTRKRNLDHPDFRPVLERAAALGVPLFIHPQIPQRAVCDVLYAGISPQVDLALSAYGLGWHYEAGVQFARLVASGTFDRLLFSTEYLYQYRSGREARRFLEGTRFDAVDRARFAHGNWERLTGSS